MDIIRERSCCRRGAGANLVASASDQAKLNHSPPRILQSPQGALSPQHINTVFIPRVTTCSSICHHKIVVATRPILSNWLQALHGDSAAHSLPREEGERAYE